MSADWSATGALARRASWLAAYAPALRIREQGRVLSVGDAIAWIDGLPSAAMDELVDFEDGSRALVFHLEERRLGAILLYQTADLAAGTSARLTGRRLEIPVGDALLGRVVDPLGTPLDGLPPARCERRRALDAPAPPIVARTFVTRPLYSGTRIIDTMIPIGKGQRQLIIGDNGVGKSALAIDAVIRQRDAGVKCVYVLVGQKRSTVVNTIDVLRRRGAFAHSVVVVAEATALPGLKYLAPFAGCAIAEAWMDAGGDTLVVYDDLTMHAQTYRELSLLLQRPPGREAYPGDIFYLHSRLLERATALAPASGGGTMTALPIIETKQGEIAAYIPTNLISITDGQLYLSTTLFDAGVLPAIDVTRSVSRIGGNAQHPAIKAEAGRTKLDYLQFLELEVFTRFGARVEPAVEARIRRGRVLREVLKQDRLSPDPVEFDMAWLVAYNEGLLDDATPDQVPERLRRLAEGVARESFSLDTERAKWAAAVKSWLSTA